MNDNNNKKKEMFRKFLSCIYAQKHKANFRGTLIPGRTLPS